MLAKLSGHDASMPECGLPVALFRAYSVGTSSPLTAKGEQWCQHWGKIIDKNLPSPVTTPATCSMGVQTQEHKPQPSLHCCEFCSARM